jgi:hypothetical protein
MVRLLIHDSALIQFQGRHTHAILPYHGCSLYGRLVLAILMQCTWAVALERKVTRLVVQTDVGA